MVDIMNIAGTGATLFSIALMVAVAAILDLLAYYVGRIWLVLLATYAVRNGRHVFLVALLCDWVIAAKDTTYVFSISLAFAQYARPFVFIDLNLPCEESLYLFRKHSKLCLVVFIFVCSSIHYPSWTLAKLLHITQHGPSWLWSHTSLLGLFKLIWQLPLSLFLLFATLNRIKAGFRYLWKERLGPGWRWLGTALYDLSPALAGFKVHQSDKESSALPTGLASDEQSETFTYRPLQHTTQTRLLYLLPNGNSDNVRCSMVHIDLSSQHPAFEALSYTWNGAELTHTIYVDNARLRVTENAHNMLQALVPVYSPRPVWIDSVCIHQGDAFEKSWQVQQMAFIYENAERVLVWLGNPPNARLAIDLILELNHIYDYGGWNDDALYERYSCQRRSPRWLAFGDLLEHTYFSRSWMIQEISNHKEVHIMYGSSLLLWKTLINVSTAIILSYKLSIYVEDCASVERKRSALINACQMYIYNLVRNKIQAGNRMSLQDTLVECWTLQATDPRDKVFAFYNAVSDPPDSLFVPNYTKSPSQVYIDTGCYLARKGPRVLQILRCAGIGWHRNIGSLPSWVPDWSTAKRAVLDALPTGGAGYNASNNLLQSDFRLVNDSMLELHAIILPGHIAELGDEFVKPMIGKSLEVDLNLMAKRTGPWMLSVRKLVANWLGGRDECCIHTEQPYEEVLWRTQLAGTSTMETGPGVAQYHRPADRRYGAHYRFFIRNLMDPVDEVVVSSQDRIQDEEELGHMTIDQKLRLASLYVSTLQMKCLSRRLAFTSDRYICLVPPRSLPGDKLGIIPELGIPVLLRPIDRAIEGVSTSAKAFELIGECYVHGIMDGEVARADKLERIALV